MTELVFFGRLEVRKGIVLFADALDALIALHDSQGNEVISWLDTYFAALFYMVPCLCLTTKACLFHGEPAIDAGHINAFTPGSVVSGIRPE